MNINLRRNAKSNTLFVCTIVACVLIIVSYIFFSDLYINRGITPVENNGIMSFKDVEIDSGREYFLKCDWEFYDEQFIISDEESTRSISGYETVPHTLLDNLRTDVPVSSGEFGSYRLLIRDINAELPITFYIPNYSGAYKIFIDGILVTTSGTVDKDTGSAVSSMRRLSLPIMMGSGMHELVVEMSSLKLHGLNMPPAVRNYQRAENHTYTLLGLRYAFIGIVLFCAIFMSILKVSSNRMIYSFWGVALCIFLAYRMMISNEGYIVSSNLFSGLSYEYMAMLIFAGTFIIKLVSLIFISRALPIKVSQTAIIAFAALFSISILIAVFFEDPIYDPYYSTLLQIVTLTLDFYLLEKICICVINKVRNAIPFLIAYSLVAVGLSVDFLYMNGIIQAPSSMFMPIVLLFFALAIMFVHANNNALLQKEALHAAKLETELADANMSIMLSQIQPHFLYNALNTIKYLVRRDTDMAEKAIVEFSLYLRGNMDSLTQKKPIPFRTELSHIKHYCEIEKMRFGKKLNIEYDIETDDFFVPTLSIQPLMENSIKHGVTKRPEGGTVTLHTYEDENNFYVSIIDDGVGFDPDKPHSDNRSHVGFSNIKSRLENMLSASIEVESEINVGTKTLVTLPKASNFGEAETTTNF